MRKLIYISCMLLMRIRYLLWIVCIARIDHLPIVIRVVISNIVAVILLWIGTRIKRLGGVVNHIILICFFHWIGKQSLNFESLLDEYIFNIIRKVIYLIFWCLLFSLFLFGTYLESKLLYFCFIPKIEPRSADYFLRFLRILWQIMWEIIPSSLEGLLLTCLWLQPYWEIAWIKRGKSMNSRNLLIYTFNVSFVLTLCSAFWLFFLSSFLRYLNGLKDVVFDEYSQEMKRATNTPL